MKDPDRLIKELCQVIPPGPSLAKVHGWVRKDRPQRRFYALIWLSRVWRRSLN